MNALENKSAFIRKRTGLQLAIGDNGSKFRERTVRCNVLDRERTALLLGRGKRLG